MKRGEVWTAAERGDYTGKPRPVVIVQDDDFGVTASVVVCGFTTDPDEAPLFRVIIAPTELNGLRSQSKVMVDKMTSVRRSRLQHRLGQLGDDDIARLDAALLSFLGLARPHAPAPATS